MRNRALRTDGRQEFITSSQLCNSLLHNWYFGINRGVGRQ
jgi:hypothetical protein